MLCGSCTRSRSLRVASVSLGFSEHLSFLVCCTFFCAAPGNFVVGNLARAHSQPVWSHVTCLSLVSKHVLLNWIVQRVCLCVCVTGYVISLTNVIMYGSQRLVSRARACRFWNGSNTDGKMARKWPIKWPKKAKIAGLDKFEKIGENRRKLE